MRCRSLSLIALFAASACTGSDAPGTSTDPATSSATDATTTTATGSTSGTASDSATDTAGTASGTGSTGGSSTGAPMCDGQCIPAPPADWMGGAAIWNGTPDDTTPGCIGEFPTQIADLSGDLQVTDPTCECECAAADGIACEGGFFREHNSADCMSLGAPSTDLIVDECKVIAPQGGYLQLTGPTPSGGSCAPNLATNEIVEPTFATRTIACQAETTDVGCEALEVCAPVPTDPFAAGLCIFRSGEHQCPEGYPEQFLRYSDVTDTRACGECSCGDPASECESMLRFFQGSCGINGVFMGQIAPGECTASAISPDRALLTATATGTCEPAITEPTGEIMLGGAVTFCCPAP